ncbi:GTPase, G3E family [Filimonas lacunae]|uniref:GTPase, G3E family n=1 Tax=Filimonas lacunae TaxID=477680 RepID=A0A173MDG7_9BACT|nr:GTP-binding protein [Filimonas lacunae]BAV05478.1 metal chaperone related to Zn homeostasis [Filimonas lacunae]SIT20846.1 GTPase, G3E family [Filimonas lacunae]
MITETRIPITILTGFLGSGKTTLLNQLLEDKKDKKIAVIENEFASYAFDADLLENKAEAIRTISSGCICCTQSGALTEAVLQMAESPEGYDHIIIEATGVADPAGVAGSLLDEMVQQHCYMDAVICMVDVQHIERLLEETEEAGRQIAFSDVLLLSRTDIPEAAARKSEVTALLTSINPLAAIHDCDFGVVKDCDIWQLFAYRTDKMVQTTEQVFQQARQPHEKIKALTFTLDEPVVFSALNFLLHSLEDVFGNNLYRIKGFVYGDNIPNRMIIQSVAGTHCWIAGAPWKEEEPRQTRLVFIGKNLQRATLEKYINTCIIPDEQEI